MIRPTRFVLAAALVPAALALAACSAADHAATQVTAAAQAQTSPSLSTADAAFLDEASRAGIETVTFAQLARTQGVRASTRDFATRLADTHTTLNQDLTHLAARKHIAPIASMDPAHQADYDRLAALHGSAFDRAWLNQQAADHQAMLRLFQGEAGRGTDADVRALAARGVPEIERHLVSIGKLGGRAAAAS